MTLIVLAATMGNRYGGLKQLEGIGPCGETILDYSVYDAARAGFSKVIFVISRHFETEFKQRVAGKYEGLIEVGYVYQEVEMVPEPLRNPKRNLLWGSAHAVLMAEEAVDGPFGVINAVNFYQRESFDLLYDRLRRLDADGEEAFLIRYRLANVLPENASVTRGICQLTPEGDLVSVVDRQGVERVGGSPMCTDEWGKAEPLDPDAWVSMNMWGFSPVVFRSLHTAFDAFVEEYGRDLKAHYSIPAFVNERICQGLRVRTVETPARWMGLVSAEDRSQAILRIGELTRKGVYPVPMFPGENNEPI